MKGTSRNFVVLARIRTAHPKDELKIAIRNRKRNSNGNKHFDECTISFSVLNHIPIFIGSKQNATHFNNIVAVLEEAVFDDLEQEKNSFFKLAFSLFSFSFSLHLFIRLC